MEKEVDNVLSTVYQRVNNGVSNFFLQPKFFGKLDFELVVGPSGPTYGQT